eukprot:jgi/Undpi1/11768/HiC_scaffold_38.g14063.m1
MDPVGTRLRGKSVRDVVDDFFGLALLTALKAHGMPPSPTQYQHNPAQPNPHPTVNVHHLLSKASDPVETRLRGKVTRDVLDKVFGSALLATLEKYSTRAAVNSETVLPRWHSGRDGQGCDDDDADVLSGKDGCAGQVQVVVSGPSSFVLSVEAILAEMGVPSAAIVLLD